VYSCEITGKLKRTTALEDLVDKMKETGAQINGVKVLPQYKTLVEQ